MITLNEIAYNIKNLAYGGKNSTENNISTSQIKHWVHYHRAKLIADNVNNGILNFTSLYQQSAVRLPQAVTNNLNEFDFYGTSNLRKNSKQNKGGFRNQGIKSFTIPEVVMLSNDAAIKEVLVSRAVWDLKNNKTSAYSSPIIIYRKSHSEMAHGNHNKFTSNDYPYYIVARYNQIFDERGKIRIDIYGLQKSPNYFGDLETPGGENLTYRYAASYSAIFQNPTELDSFNEETTPYPIPAQYVGDLVQRVLQTEVQVELKTRADEMTDGADDNMKMRASGA
tara:strand:- start:4553 stop:5395 length:843 start_codon:yes stop_codon:yes gene_type:complete